MQIIRETILLDDTSNIVNTINKYIVHAYIYICYIYYIMLGDDSIANLLYKLKNK